jgi:hypothetical protein
VSQVALLVALHGLGVAIALAWGPRARPALACALGFPIGLAAVVAVALPVLAIGLPYGPALLGAVAIVAGLAVRGARRRGLDRRGRRVALAWTAGFAAAAAAAATVNLSHLNYDSHQLVALGRAVALDGGFEAGVLERLASWGVFQVIAQSLAVLIGAPYLDALAPVLAASLLGLLAALLAAGAALAGPLGRRGALAIALVVAATASLGMLERHAVFVHTNLGSALYLLAFVGTWWLAEVTDDPSGLPVAFGALLGFALQRIEAPLIALGVVAIAVLPSRLPRPAIGPPLAAVSLAIAMWFLYLAREAPPVGPFLTTGSCVAIAGATLAGLAAWRLLGRPRLAPLARHAPAAAAIALGLGLAALFATRPGHMAASLGAWVRDLTELPQWGASAYLLAALAIAAAALPAPPAARRIVGLGVVLVLGMILALAAGRVPYRFHVDDSANRMTLHVLPLLLLYVGLAWVPTVNRPAAAPSAAASASDATAS